LDTDAVVTLWQLPELIEDQFEARWEHWLDNAADWADFFQRLETPPENDLPAALSAVCAVTEADLGAFTRLARPEGVRALALPNPFSGTDEDVALLAIGFAQGGPGSLVVPYAPRGEC
jgi:hypothetical protein